MGTPGPDRQPVTTQRVIFRNLFALLGGRYGDAQSRPAICDNSESDFQELVCARGRTASSRRWPSHLLRAVVFVFPLMSAGS